MEIILVAVVVWLGLCFVAVSLCVTARLGDRCQISPDELPDVQQPAPFVARARRHAL